MPSFLLARTIKKYRITVTIMKHNIQGLYSNYLTTDKAQALIKPDAFQTATLVCSKEILALW